VSVSHWLKGASALFAFCALALVHVCALAQTQTDGFFLPSGPQATTSGSEPPVYDSEYSAEMRLHGSFGNTPEADARPGEYYFLLGAQAFRKHEYAFAINMYEVAASWAYKPAEYNLAVMYARGQGIAVDLPRAMAWMALAAERNEQRYVDARETVYASLTAEQFAQANEIWRELKKTYGDDVALRRAKARWAQVRAAMTGSRVGSVGHLDVGMPAPNSGDPSGPKLPESLKQFQTGRSSASTPGEATGGNGVDGSKAYRQLRESNNPYDPKFETSALGKATVGPIKEVKTPPATEAGDDADAAKEKQ